MRVSRFVLPWMFPLFLGAQETPEDLEHTHLAVGFSFPTGVATRHLDAGWNAALGNVYELSTSTALLGELDYHALELTSDAVRNLGFKDGHVEIASALLGGLWRIKATGNLGPCLLGGAGLYRRRIYFEPAPSTIPADNRWAGLKAGEIQDSPVTCTRGGIWVGAGWEFPRGNGGTFFIEVRYHRIFTPAEATELIPLMVGTRF